MNFIKKLPVFIALACLGIPAHSFAQYQFDCDPFFSYFKDIKRWEIYGGIALPSGNFSGVTSVQSPGYVGDTTMKRKLAGQTAFGGGIDVFAPFKRTGHISYWGVDAGIMVNDIFWHNLNQIYNNDGGYNNNSTLVNASTLQISIPLGISYKVGCDAIESKRLALCAAFGAGIIPQINMTSLEGVSQFNTQYGYGVTPYAKMDLGFFAGFCWKVRFMYTVGKVNLFDANAAIPKLTDGPFGISSTGSFMISLVINPFAVGWHETNWWNTYDTYNQHDRLN